MAITFDDPPINEVVLGRVFLPRSDFLLPYYGDFWGQVRNEFPTVSQAQPILVADQAQLPSGDDAFILPRVWLISKDSTRLVQLQYDRFYYNWRQTTERPEYVRFPTIRDAAVPLWEQFERYVAKVTGEPLKVVSNELTYINVIAVKESKSITETTDAALVDSNWGAHQRFLLPPRQVNHVYTFEVPDGLGALTMNSVGAVKKTDGSPVLKLELTVRGKAQDGIAFKDWAQVAHDFLVKAFKDLTKPSAHEMWKLREG